MDSLLRHNLSPISHGCHNLGISFHVEPKDEVLPTTHIMEQKGGKKPEPPAKPQPVPTA
ncbi:unnamed protein product [Nyctereutes procyonoides]|uniref:(raccoon dog) hypothetical protein n=1 Tax=Nyctereutes procyonoides TaxID=34880 RepID=A0A811XZ57_NYCPR|nr:unnamed protein product [Nyctereutes procyonoides]